MITLVTMAQGNPLALKRTLDSFAPICDEVIFGDLLVFEDDRELISTYGVKSIALPFNFIFKNGFAETLNELAKHAKNDWVLYMNCSEVMENDTIFFEHPTANCYCFDHATDPHRWFRLYNRHELKWNGLIHEELIGKRRQQDTPIFRMADTPKDDTNAWKAKVYNDIKELVYFKQYLRLVQEPSSIGVTNRGWVEYAQRDYNYINERIEAKGLRLQAFENGDLELYLTEIYSAEFVDEFKDSEIIHFQ